MSGETRQPEPLDEVLLRLLRDGGEEAVRAWVARNADHADDVDELLPALRALEDMARSARSRGGTAEDVPDRIGDFRIIREIGRGGMGVVFEAEQESMGRRVAVKMLPPSSFTDGRAVARFRREAQAAGRLRHDHIVPVYGVGELEGRHYYVMQFVDGQGVDRLLAELRLERWRPTTSLPSLAVSDFLDLDPSTERVASPRVAGTATSDKRDADGASETSAGGATRSSSRMRASARMVRDVADALAHAHGNGILHRDIKPSNLLLDRDGRVWVADFGLAKSFDAADLTGTGEVVGTPLYMAPEMFDGEADVRSDVYSLGLVLYELLTLRTAVEPGPRVEVMGRILAGSPNPPRHHDARIPRDLETVVLEAIRREPNGRYPDAAAMRDDLQRFLDGRPVRARRASLADRVAKWARRHPITSTVLGVAAIAVTALVLVVVSTGEARDRAEDDYVRAREAIDRLTSFGEKRLREVPGGAVARRDMLIEARAAYGALLAGRDDAKTRLQTAVATRRLAWIEAELGSMNEALSLQDEALELLDGIAMEGEDDDADLERGMVLDERARVLRSVGRVIEGADVARRADAILARLAAERPDSMDHADSAAGAANNLALALEKSGLPGAIAAHRRAIALIERFASGERYRRRWLATTRMNLAIALSRRGEEREAQSQLQVASGLLDDDGDPDGRRLRASVRSTLANQLRRNGDVDSSIDEYRASIAILDGLIADFPLIREHVADRAQVCSDLGIALDDACIAGGECRHEEARRMTLRAIADYRDLEDRFGLDGLRLPRARALGNLGRSRVLHGLTSGSAREARGAWLEMLSLLESMDGNAACDAERATALNHLAWVESSSDPASADARFEEAVTILERLTASGSMEAQHNLAGTLNNHAELLRATGRKRRARELLERGIELERAVLATAPDSHEYRLFLLNLEYNLALTAIDLGDHEDGAELAASFVDTLPGEEAEARADHVIEKAIEAARRDTDLDADDLEELIGEYRSILERTRP